MKYLKILGLAAVVAAALMAFAGTASATVLTGTGCAETGCAKGTVIKSELKEGKAVLTGSFGNVECSKSTLEGEVEKPGSGTETVSGPITSLTFTECNCEVVVLKKGSLEIHTEGATANGNGTLTASGQEVTTNCNFFGLNFHCIWSTNATDLGKLTGGTPATISAEKASITRSGGTSGKACGETGAWDAKYKVTAPATLTVD